METYTQMHLGIQSIIKSSDDFARPAGAELSKNLWTNADQSVYIESLILRPRYELFYFAFGQDDIIEVLDGYERLMAIVNFANGRLRLRGLRTLKMLNGKTIDQLNSPAAQSLLRVFNQTEFDVVFLSEDVSISKKQMLYRNLHHCC